MKNYLVFFGLILNLSMTFAQPSCVMGLEFKVFKNGEIVKYDSLIANYQLLDIYDNECSFGFRNFRTDGIKKTFSFIGGTGCYDLKKKIVFQGDTMVLKLKYHLKEDFEKYAIDSLIFKKGKYLIQENQLEKINFEKSATDYYNEIVQFVRERKKVNPEFKNQELNQLRNQFNISINDYDNKTKSQLFSKNKNSIKGEIFIVRSSCFKINNLQCNWEYGIKYTDETNKNSKEPFVNLISQELIAWETKELLLDLDLTKFVYIPPKSISELEYNKYPDSSIDKLIDVNSDNYIDIQFMTELAGGGANTAYATYLFNPMNGQFEYSEIFSGYNINYNSKKNRITTFGKSSVEDYYYTYFNLKKNKKDVLFVEKVRHYGDTIFYEKIINKNVVKQKRILTSETKGWESYLERK